jgi:hypothetical protein
MQPRHGTADPFLLLHLLYLRLRLYGVLRSIIFQFGKMPCRLQDNGSKGPYRSGMPVFLCVF